MSVRIVEVDKVTPDLVEAFVRLTPQLSKSNPPPGEAQLRELVESPATALLMAVDEDDGDRFVGTLTLVLFRIPTALRAWIEDVIVDEAVGGRGIGKALTREALARAKAAGAKTVELTSRPSREVANGMYRSLGFEPRDTNVYRFTLES
ncbi:MAG TPA: GNAT family N-acetyltransferase [Acidimicrobiales bacterium]|nr:GNAT family N-acetyltransferase [Acidimicrobiales bacterium]